MADEKTFSKDEVLELWSDKAGRKDNFDLREVESLDGVKQTQLVNKETGSLVVAVNGHGEDAINVLGRRVGDPFIDPGVNPKEAQGEENEKFFTSEGVLATPTQPETLEGNATTRNFVGGREVSQEAADKFQAEAQSEVDASKTASTVDENGEAKTSKKGK